MHNYYNIISYRILGPESFAKLATYTLDIHSHLDLSLNLVSSRISITKGCCSLYHQLILLPC